MSRTTYNSAQRQAGVAAAINNARSTLPVMCVESFYNAATVATFDVVRADMQTACRAASPAVPLIDAQGWVSGHGYIYGATAPAATAKLTGGAVSRFTITNAGSGLTRAPTMLIKS